MRMDYLQKYLAFQARKNNGHAVHAMMAEEKKLKEDKVVPRTRYQLEQEYGLEMVKHWIDDTKSLEDKWRPNRVSGSSLPQFREYLLCDDTLSTLSSFSNASQISAEGAAKAEDMGNILALKEGLDANFHAATASSATDTPGAIQADQEQHDESGEKTTEKAFVKQEPQEEQAKGEIEDTAGTQVVEQFLAKPAVKLNELQQAATSLKVMIEKCDKVRFAESFKLELMKVNAKVEKAVRIMSKICMGEKPIPDKVPKLLSVMNNHLKEVASLKGTGEVQFGMSLGEFGGSKRRRKAPQ